MNIEHDFETRFRQIDEAGKRARASDLAAMERLKGRLQRLTEERQREEAAMADPVARLYRLAASRAGTLGQRIALMQGVQMTVQGRPEAGGVLVELGGLDFIPALAEAAVQPPALRIAIETALLEHYRELPAFIAAHGGRAAFAAWCRQAKFTVPATLPETIDIYRGTMGCSPAAAAQGLHWTESFKMACFYACRFCDRHLTGVIVVKAKVCRGDLVAAIEGIGEHELIPAAVPAEIEIITDHERIIEAGHRALVRYREQIARGHRYIPTHGIAEQAAMATRARMAAAGVAPGTAIVA